MEYTKQLEKLNEANKKLIELYKSEIILLKDYIVKLEGFLNDAYKLSSKENELRS